jgi:hypothetical protein
MPRPDASIVWWMPLLAVGVVVLVAFLVSFVFTDVLRLPRPAYLVTLMVVTGVLVSGYLAWSGTDVGTFLTRHWGWGLLGALASGALTVRMVMTGASRRGIPTPAGRSGAHLAGTLLWEGLCYGVAEGLLLSALPILATWQSFQLLGWTGSTAGVVCSGVLAIGASAAVIWIHHRGYREFRGTREILLPILACGLLSLAYLLTASPIAPAGGHVLLHGGMVVRGISMPPYSKRLAAPAPRPRLRPAA